MATYDFYRDLAAVYDQRDHTRIVRAFERRLRPLVKARPADTWVLDLGCGTGLLSDWLGAEGVPVIGIDLAPQMLTLARQRCRRHGRRTLFQQGDLTTFRVRQPCSVASASGEIINHLPSLGVVRRALRNVHRNLQPGGVLMFDSLRRFCYEQYWAECTYHMEGEGGDLVLECDWDPRRRAATAWLVGYVKEPDGRYRKIESELHERYYTDRELREALRAAGFRDIRREEWSAWEDQHLQPDIDRNLWTARAR